MSVQGKNVISLQNGFNEMSTFLINASNLKQGGGVQVAQSLIAQTGQFPQHQFVVALSNHIPVLLNSIQHKNTIIFRYSIKNTLGNLIWGRDGFLDRLVIEQGIDAVLTVFGPSRWRPRVPHLCGFARAQLVLTDSPYNERLTLKEKVVHRIWTWLFKRSSDVFYTENEFISELLPNVLGKRIKVYTVSNCYNQVFDLPHTWHMHPLPPFDGVTCLSVSAYYPHKNYPLLVAASRVLKHKHPGFRFRFILTFDKGLMDIPEELRDHFVFIGKVDVSECPDLYRQSDIMVMPTLLECFTATYPEAMRMRVPIVTTDLEFARGLCCDAACYYSAVDAEACAEAIYKVAMDKEYAHQLVENGRKQLQKFDNYEQRAEKLVRILEVITE